MSPNEKWALLWLDGPMQAWGASSRFDRRTSLAWPTKSGVIGMICAAAGIPKADRETLAAFAGLAMEALVFRPGELLIDYHTAGGGYDDRTERLKIPRTADGKSRKTALSLREYRMGAKFGVLLSGPADVVERIEPALNNPVWGVWLGRKSCLPASPVCRGTFPDRADAMDALIRIGNKFLGKDKKVRQVLEVADFDDGSDTVSDVPVDFSSREFMSRRVRVDTLRLEENDAGL